MPDSKNGRKGALAYNEEEDQKLKDELAEATALEELADDLEALDDNEDSLLKGLADTPVQKVVTRLDEWYIADDARAKLTYKIKVARQAKDRDEVKKLSADLIKLRTKLLILVKNLIEALEQEDEVRENVDNWLMVRTNLRPLLKKHLKARGKDPSVQIVKAEAIEAERRALREGMEQIDLTDEDVRISETVSGALEKGKTGVGAT